MKRNEFKMCNSRTGSGDKDSLKGGALQRTTPVIRITTLDDIVDNFDVNTADTDAVDQGKHAH